MPIRSIYLFLLNFHLKKRGGKKTENEERNTRLFRAEDEPANFPPILISRIWKLLHCFSKSVKLQERWSTEVPGPILQRIQEDSDPMSLVTETSAKLPARNSRIETFTVIQHRTDNCSLSIYSRCVSFVELAPTLRRSNSGFEQPGMERLVTSFFFSFRFVESEYRCFAGISYPIYI